MNRVCPGPGCNVDLPAYAAGEPRLVTSDLSGYLEIEMGTNELVPYDETMRPERYGPDGDLDGRPPVGGLWFCSEACRDAYTEANDA